ncbi:MAG: prolyl aminopeptidase [Chlamydiae bacterium RIFCSPHIGHO2_12_FULL_44_59]|nr:MAG: prolyl aminopeptidase [Chlamydiae bacterium RIFCSPHIGHO2_01_FULL_44_39]OGN60854.1 MAG: prolyl aminopeptidase [Chlamydiae bacterium RIFCSPHIGHO2_12_FULL_44_59]OGN66730.1 MAG: prolyl aminopeptidase [Chlamydiae bacterium RIFCSPLOWO2_01_FULL_44_52]OGN67380.1 MAG: prolyl aminopeptidase [Chlamydiae bacterium RIFCSPLOWO2_02_FULL_45_22]OGN70655.1 MAG: prolyl aminopeptidase [Chlamydiae bacterium RIFCSPLOWO2_12_FULL_45_20]
MRTPYPPIEPHRSGYLQRDNHEVYWEECGNPKGLPVIFLHGGPGSGCNPSARCYFDPEVYRIVLMDQRGCGRSRPHSSLENNTTWHLVRDIERLRESLSIKKWLVFGGSWGSTLALAYAETHPQSCLALVLRGIFLCRSKELHWLYQFGAHHILPDEFEKYIAPIPEAERGDLMGAYYRQLTSENAAMRRRAAHCWSAWEGVALKLLFDPKLFEQFTEDVHADAIARIECHYFIHKGFFTTDNWLLENVDTIQDIPAVIIQGRYDLVTPMESAWELHKAYPKAQFEVIPDAGHASSEPGIMNALLRATEYFGRQFR